MDAVGECDVDDRDVEEIDAAYRIAEHLAVLAGQYTVANLLRVSTPVMHGYIRQIQVLTLALQLVDAVNLMPFCQCGGKTSVDRSERGVLLWDAVRICGQIVSEAEETFYCPLEAMSAEWQQIYRDSQSVMERAKKLGLPVKRDEGNTEA